MFGVIWLTRLGLRVKCLGLLLRVILPDLACPLPAEKSPQISLRSRNELGVASCDAIYLKKRASQAWRMTWQAMYAVEGLGV